MLLKDNNKILIKEQDWDRKESFDFFKQFEKSYYGIGTSICVNGVVKYKEEHTASFYGLMSYLLLKACNNVINFRYRLEDQNVILYKNISCSCTILKADNNIAYTNRMYISSNVEQFLKLYEENKDLVLNGKKSKDNNNGNDIIYLTSLNWFKLRYMDNVRRTLKDDTIPRFAFGKYYWANGAYQTDLSIEMSHMFVDGFHIQLLLSEIEKINNELEHY